MAGCGCKHYGSIDRGEFKALKKKLKDEGVDVPDGDSGSIKAPFGIKGTFNYDEQRQTLKVCITDKKFFVPCRRIWEVIDEVVIPHTKD